MSLSLFFTIQDSISKMTKQVLIPLRRDGSDASHVAAHGAGDIFMKLREDMMRDELGDSSKSQKERFLEWETGLSTKLKNASDHSKFLALLLLQRLRSDIEAADFDLPPSQTLTSLTYNKEDKHVLNVMTDIDRINTNDNTKPPPPR